MFILFEGIDGAGTTTQRDLLVQHLDVQGFDVLSTEQPSKGRIGVMAREIIASGDAPSMAALPWLFAADRADHLANVIEPALKAGRWVVCDRYIGSSFAYQAPVHGANVIRDLNCHFREPDLTFLIDIEPEVAIKRIAGRASHDVFETLEGLKSASSAYRRWFAEEVPGLKRELDGKQTIEEVQATIQLVVELATHSNR